MELTVRPVRATDKSAVLGISRRIWGGHDYVPMFFSRWVRDGNFWIGEVSGRVIGCGKASELAPGEWWLEGLRLDPDWRGKGLGRELSCRILDRTLRLKPRSLRLSTASMNRTSIHIIGEMGFRLLSTHHLHSGRPRKPSRQVRLAVPEPGEALDYIRASSEYRAANGLMPYTWLFREVSLDYVRELGRRRFLNGYRTNGRLQGVLVVRPHRYFPQNLDISFVDGSPAAIQAFGRYIRQTAERRGSRHISAMPASRKMALVLSRWGIRSETGRWRVLVFEYPLRRR